MTAPTTASVVARTRVRHLPARRTLGAGNGPVLLFSPGGWASFIGAVKGGRLA
ncbi:DUF397 domain-containing protein [Streptomyces sp. NPDC012751]|uniref:DUF397 domain-containing protein n=1 Tax=Streptomyces sp. NPDC012751 TaxID=3364846 RepID=UPI00368676CB